MRQTRRKEVAVRKGTELGAIRRCDHGPREEEPRLKESVGGGRRHGMQSSADMGRMPDARHRARCGQALSEATEEVTASEPRRGTAPEESQRRGRDQAREATEGSEEAQSAPGGRGEREAGSQSSKRGAAGRQQELGRALPAAGRRAEVTSEFLGYLNRSKGLTFESMSCMLQSFPNGVATNSNPPLPTPGEMAWEELLEYTVNLAGSGGIGSGWKLRKRRRRIEIVHGCKSMLAAMGDGAVHTDSPLLASVSEIGGQSLAGFCDPAGFRRHRIEIEHGCLSTIRVMGYINKWKPPRLPSSDGGAKSTTGSGRVAMVAISGMFLLDGLIGNAWGDGAKYSDSPLRAFVSEFGAQAPAGVWDPAGFYNDGGDVAFKRRRLIEIKHGGAEFGMARHSRACRETRTL